MTGASQSYAYDDNCNRIQVDNAGGANQEYVTGDDNRLTEDEFYTYPPRRVLFVVKTN